jgi:hypothetical protein
MLAVVDPVTLSASSFVLFSVYGLALGAYGLLCAGFMAFFLIIVASVGLGVSIANVALVYNSYIGIRIFRAEQLEDFLLRFRLHTAYWFFAQRGRDDYFNRMGCTKGLTSRSTNRWPFRCLAFR